MDDNYNYEEFIINAFSYALGTNIGRYGDPAELADTDAFESDNIDSIKCAIGYSMNIFNNKIEEKFRNSDESYNQEEIDRIKNFIKEIIEASTLIDISTILNNYNRTVKDEYFNHLAGVITLK